MPPHNTIITVLQIYKKEVCFWDYPSCAALAAMCDNKEYPPRFVLEVDGRRATESTIAKVTFSGAMERFKRTEPFSDVKLACYPQGIYFVYDNLVTIPN